MPFRIVFKATLFQFRMTSAPAELVKINRTAIQIGVYKCLILAP